MLQPSLSGDARISVICTINPSKEAIAESTSTLLFAQRIKRVQVSVESAKYLSRDIVTYIFLCQLHAQRKEVVDTEALLERYRKEIEELRRRLAEREADPPGLKRRLSAREVRS
jgi:centromeric protein E